MTTPQPQSSPAKFSKRILNLAQAPKNRGAFFTEDANERSMALVTAKYKDIKVYWLVDPETNTIYDAKFFAYGGTLSIAIGEAICGYVKGLSLKSAAAVTITQLEATLRDDLDTPATAEEMEKAFANLPELLKAVEDAYPEAKAVALASQKLRAAEGGDPRSLDPEALSEQEKQWFETPKEKQLERVNEILDRDIRPGLNFDGGDLEVEDLEEGERLKVRYQGACGGCASSTGATLSYIEDTFRRQLYSRLQVIPVE